MGSDTEGSTPEPAPVDRAPHLQEVDAVSVGRIPRMLARQKKKPSSWTMRPPSIQSGRTALLAGAIRTMQKSTMRSFSLLYSLHGGARVMRLTTPGQDMRISSSKHALSRMSCSGLASRSKASKRERPDGCMCACVPAKKKASLGVRRHLLTVRLSSAMFGREVVFQRRWQRLGQFACGRMCEAVSGPC